MPARIPFVHYPVIGSYTNPNYEKNKEDMEQKF